MDAGKNLWLLFNKTAVRNLHNNVKFNSDAQQIRRDFQRLSLQKYEQTLQLLDIGKQYGQSANGLKLTQFTLTTIYPGLAAGLGYSHTTGESEEEFKMGFQFDYATGLPVLPGSSVKGRLRSFFPERYKDAKKKEEVAIRLRGLIKELVKERKISLDEAIFEDDKAYKSWVRELEYQIFEGRKVQDGPRVLSTVRQDAFFDAYPVSTLNEAQKFMAEESLTPHDHPLMDPLPLRLLKILPDVDIQFQFRLNEEGGLSAADKATLFKNILLQFGAGAKSNTGYGQFKQDQSLDPKFESIGYVRDMAQARAQTHVPIADIPPAPQPYEPPKPKALAKDEILGTLKEYNDGVYTVLLEHGNPVIDTIVFIRYAAEKPLTWKMVIQIDFDKRTQKIKSARFKRWYEQ